MAQKSEDILSRRFRLTFLDSVVSEQVTEKVNTIIEKERAVVNKQELTINS